MRTRCASSQPSHCESRLARELHRASQQGERVISKTTQELKTEIQKTMSLLHTLRDEARVKVHLAQLEVKDAWSKLEPKLEEAEKMAEEASEATLTTITMTAKKLQKLVASL